MRANYFVGMFEENTDTETHTHTWAQANFLSQAFLLKGSIEGYEAAYYLVVNLYTIKTW